MGDLADKITDLLEKVKDIDTQVGNFSKGLAENSPDIRKSAEDMQKITKTLSIELHEMFVGAKKTPLDTSSLDALSGGLQNAFQDIIDEASNKSKSVTAGLKRVKK